MTTFEFIWNILYNLVLILDNHFYLTYFFQDLSLSSFFFLHYLKH